jgi:hypothetical protein
VGQDSDSGGLSGIGGQLVDPLRSLRDLRGLPGDLAELGPTIIRLTEAIERQQEEGALQREETVRLRQVSEQLVAEVRHLKVELKVLIDNVEQIRERIPGL